MDNSKFYPVRYSREYREYELLAGGHWYPVLDFLHDGFDATPGPPPFTGRYCESYTLRELELILQHPTILS